jgi:hypothetical protein
VELVWSCEFQQITDAISAERPIKAWSRVKKEALIRGDETALVLLAATPHSVQRQEAGSVGMMWDRNRASFETAATRPPQDEENFHAIPDIPHPEGRAICHAAE